jgi:biotin carboxylase
MVRKVSDVEVLRGKRIAFVTSGYAGKRFIYEKAKTLGVISTIIDSPTSWAKSLVDEGVIETFIGVDFGQPVESVVADILQAIRDQDIHLDGVCTFAELSLPITAKLAACLELPGNEPDVVALTRDKHKVRKIVAGAGLNEIRSYPVKTVDDLASAAHHVGFPAVLKPISGADSLGVKKVNTVTELSEAFQQMYEVMQGLVVSSGALLRTPAGTPVVPSENAGRFIQLDLSMEEYLDGPEVDVDIVLYKGQCFFGAVVDNGPTTEPYFAETWNLCPSLLPADHQEELLAEALATLKALGFQDGVFHVEEKYTKRGPRIIEVNARMGGGPIRLQHKYVYGVDLVEEQLLSCIGVAPSVDCESRLAVPLEPNRCYVSSTPNAARSGVVKNLSFLDHVRTRPDLLGLWEFVQPDTPVVGPEDGQPSWLCEVALVGDQGSHELLKSMNELVDTILLHVEYH